MIYRLPLHALLLAAAASTFIIGACTGRDPTMTDSTPAPPVAARQPYSATHHGVTLEDPYHWLKDPSYPNVDDPQVLAYLRAENNYFRAMMAPHEDLVETLFQEIKARQQPDEVSVPARDGGRGGDLGPDADLPPDLRPDGGGGAAQREEP